MDINLGLFANLFPVALALIFPVLLIIALTQNWSLVPPPKERDFHSAPEDWARQRGLNFAPQKAYVISGAYNNIDTASWWIV